MLGCYSAELCALALFPTIREQVESCSTRRTLGAFLTVENDAKSRSVNSSERTGICVHAGSLINEITYPGVREIIEVL